MADDLTEKFEAIKNEVEDMIKKWKEQKPEGLKGFFLFMYSIVGDLIELVEVSAEVVKTDKKETVVAAFKYAYDQINPDIPWIPEPMESMIENWLFDAALPTFIDWLVAKYNEKGIFTHANG